MTGTAMTGADVTGPAPDGRAHAPMPDGFHPFWFWNHTISADEVERQVALMDEQGVRGFFIHSRQGLGQPYLSDGFLDLVEVAIAAARARGMAVHLYDEYPYPSGAAGGAVVQSDPALAGTTLQASHWALPGGPVRVALPAGNVLVCRAFPVQGDEVAWDRALDLTSSVGMVLTVQSYYDASPQAYNDRRFFADSPRPILETTLAEGRWQVWALSQVVVSGHKYWGSFPDITNPAAVERFMARTHERYRQRLGAKMAGIASMFVDEVEPVPSASVISRLRHRHGDQVGDVLLAYAAPGHPSHVKAVREMQEVLLQMFESSFDAPVAAWCHRNGLRYSGEKPSLRLSQLAWMDIPGCEPGHTKAGAPRSDLLQAEIRGNAKATASAAYFYGKEGSLCECFHSLGWGATLQDAKLIAESLLLLGTRWLVPHAFFYSVDGLRKHDAPPSFFHMPYWSLFGRLSARVDAISKAFEGTWVDAAIGVLEPAGGLPDASQLACYEELQHALLGAHLDFLTVDLPLLSGAGLSDGAVTLRDVRLRSIVVPPMRDPEPGLEQWLAGFAAAGGQVVRVEGPGDVAAAVRRVAAHCPAPLGVDARSGDAVPVLTVCRTDGRDRRWLLVNTAREPVDLRLSLPDEQGLVPLPMGEAWVRRPVARDGGYDLRLEGFESALVQAVGHSRPTGVGDGDKQGSPVGLGGEGPWAMRLLGPNLLRLGRWRMSLPGHGDGSALVEPAPLANQLLRSRLRFAPLIVDRFGSSPTVGFPEMLVRYETSFECQGLDCQGGAGLRLLMQPEALTGRWRAWVDGAGPYGREAFGPTPGPVEGCIGLAFAGLGATRAPGADGPGAMGALPHRHVIALEVDAGDGSEGLRDSIYVGGEFGVFRAGAGVGAGDAPDGGGEAPVLAGIGPLPSSGTVGAWEGNGLPYYAGTVEYQTALVLSPDGEDEHVDVHLDLPSGCEDAAEIAFGDGPFRAVPWSPRRALVPRRDLAGGGPAVVRVRTSSTLDRAFEGRRFDTGAHAYLDVELSTPSTVLPVGGGSA